MVKIKKETPLSERKTATLRKEAEEKGIEGFEAMERKDLIVALEGIKKEAKETSKSKAPKPKKGEEAEEPSVGVEEDRTPVGSKAAIMKAKLAKQPKVRILIPLEGKEKIGSTMPVTLNGYRLNIQKGVYVDVPEQVARIIMKSQQQTIAALDGENPKTGKKTRLEGNESELEG